MFRRSTLLTQRLLPAVATLALLLAPLPGAAEATLVTGDARASASLNFRIVIPPVMRVIENSHPAQIGSDQPVEQRLVVLSNLKHGFCASLRLSDPTMAGWRLQTDEVGGITLQPLADGYRLCASRPGRYTLRLQHDFGTTTTGHQTAMAWPVRTELMAL
jgi:hypothetical protein